MSALDTAVVRDLKSLYSSKGFEEKYTYTKAGLGAVCTWAGTEFTLWSPIASQVWLLLYKTGEDEQPYQKLVMAKGPQGTWKYCTKKNLHGVYYQYDLLMGQNHVITGDPYAKACGINGQKSMAVDLSKTDPKNWDLDQAPPRPAENIIYEIHIKEFSWDPAGGFPKDFRGKYKAFTCEHTSLNNDGIHATGLDYLKNLGITHVQLMPAFDYATVDERGEDSQFNWGYDPQNYNVPEGSYATDPSRGEVRIREFKEMIQSLHKNGFRVIMDVVYNHTYSLDSPLQKTVPWYYYRSRADGTGANGSACGNDIASERSMCARYILESVLYWAKEYHIDGFRFDLMGLLDTELMNTIQKNLDDAFGPGEKLIFGEPWSAGATPMENGHIPALKKNAKYLNAHVGMFCDNTRDAIKGHVFEGNEPGFVNGRSGLEEDILRSARAWCNTCVPVKAPSQVISYVSAHDNWTLWDKLFLATAPDSGLSVEKAYRLAAGIYMTCQGSLFMLSGEEFGRTKEGLENSYNAPIQINRLDWTQAWANKKLVDFYRGLIALRKQLPGLCDKTDKAYLRFKECFIRPMAAGYLLDNRLKDGSFCEGSRWDEIFVIYNSGIKARTFTLPEGTWEFLANSRDSFLWQTHETVKNNSITAAPQSFVILGLPGGMTANEMDLWKTRLAKSGTK
ncbi:MAG TPA: type I pullulanase [Candidatus Scybalocola faecavium]|nr:type I pullulanase [Candidatus Scybalocola faecavium]